MRNQSLNAQEIGGEHSQITQEDLLSLRDMLGLGKTIKNQAMGTGGSVIGNSSLIWPMQSMRQSILSIN